VDVWRKLDTVLNKLDRIDNDLDTVLEKLDKLDTVLDRLDKLDTVLERLEDDDDKLETINDLVQTSGGEYIASTTKPAEEGLIMSSGNSTELFIPSTGQSCILPEVGPARYYSHTVNGLFVCGGGRTADHCMHFSQGSWNKSHSLPGGRWAHSSVMVGESLVLIGGEDGLTTDVLDTWPGVHVKPVRPGFTLKHFSMWSCSMPELLNGDIIVTGGIQDKPCCDGSPIVSLYNMNGWIRDLAPLNQGRVFHGCGSLLRSDGTQVLMVAGGSVAKRGDVLSSTEALVGLDAVAWTNMSPLPKAMTVGSATLGNTLYIASGGTWDDERDEILAWDVDSQEWQMVGKMTKAQTPAMSTVKLNKELLSYC